MSDYSPGPKDTTEGYRECILCGTVQDIKKGRTHCVVCNTRLGKCPYFSDLAKLKALGWPDTLNEDVGQEYISGLERNGEWPLTPEETDDG